MQWYHVANGQQAGPVSDAQLDELIRAGTIKNETMVWREGMTAWQPLSTARPAVSPPPIPANRPPAQAGNICAECGKSFSTSDMLFLNQSWVCAACKPMVLQRLREGAAPVGGFGGLWRSGKQLVVRSEVPLPDRCVKCNAPANGFRLKRQLTWHSPWVYLLVLPSVLIYLLVALCVRKKALLHVGLCQQHRAKRTQSILASWIAFFLGLALLVFAISKSLPLVGLGGAVLMIVAIVFGIAMATIVSAAKITKENAWVKGVTPAYLAELPEWSDL